MNSSPSDNESESLFPATNGGGVSIHGGADAPMETSELSPPLSQEAGSQPNAESMDMGMGTAQSQGSNSIGNRMNVGNILSREPHGSDEPGYAWFNTKAKDDYNRAFAEILDKNFTLSMNTDCSNDPLADDGTENFGDPFDEPQRR